MRLAERAPVPRPLRRLRRGRARGVVPGRRASSRWSSRTGAPSGADPRQRPGRSGSGGADVVAASASRPRCAACPAAPYDVVFLDPPYPLGTDDGRRRRCTRCATTTGWCPARWSSSSAPSRSDPPDFPDGFTDVRERRYGETTLWYGHAASPPARHRGRLTESHGGTRAPSRVPRVVRPGDQRAPRHRRPGRQAVRRGRGRRRGQPVQEPAVHRRRADRRCCAGPASRLGQRAGRLVHRPAHRLLPRARRSRPSSRGCGRSATSTTSCRWRR